MLTIVSWNIQYGKGVDGHIDLSRIAREILIDGFPDLICLQEVSRNYPATDNGSDQVAELQKFLGQSREVLWESMKPDGTISGYTDNYIRVVLNELYNSDLRNQLLPVRLKELKGQTILGKFESG